MSASVTEPAPESSAPCTMEETEQQQAQGSDTNDENDMSQATIDKYSDELNLALESSDVASVERLCRLPGIRSYTPYHLTKLENVLSWGNVRGEAQERCWQAMASAWPDSIDAHLAELLRAAVQGGPLSALTTLIQKVRQRSVSALTELTWHLEPSNIIRW